MPLLNRGAKHTGSILTSFTRLVSEYTLNYLKV
jgi:hypothetical protein